MSEEQLISREILFGNPDHISVKISPDGENITFLAPKDGVLNIALAPATNIEDYKFITDDKSRGIRSYYWAMDNEHIIYAQDKEGDENWSLYSVSTKTLKQVVLTPKSGVRSSSLKISNNYPKEILVITNERMPEYFDIYKVNIETGMKDLVYENTGKYISFIADENFNIRVGYKMLPSGEGEIYLFENGDMEKSKLFKKIPPEDTLTTTPLHISEDGKKLFMIDSTDRNTSELLEINLGDFTKKTIHSDLRADISDYLVDTKTKLVEAVSIEYMRKEWTVIDNKILNDFSYLKSVDNGDFEVVSRSYNSDKWIVVFENSDTPYKYYFYDRDKKLAKFLFTSNSKQEGLPFAKMHPVLIKSEDNLDLISYLTLPKWLEDNASHSKKSYPLPRHPIPLILLVHGGPNARDSWRFTPTVQWLANRGYAVLNVNYRGSTGFGKNFTNAGDGQWAKAMQKDLEDAVKWAIDNNITEKDKVVIMGGSYGGYATLVGMSMTPDMYVAGVDIVGPSNLETLMRSIPPYWKPHIAHLEKIIGASYETEEGRRILQKKSPLTYAKNIKKPLLVVQGANDPRVKKQESDQIVDLMKKHAIPVLYLLYPDEGHGLVRPENKLSMYACIEVFLARFAGGRLMPHDNKFPGSSIQIKEGSEIGWIK